MEIKNSMKIENWKLKIQHRAFTLIDVLVGISLIVIIFLGILGAYQLALKVVALSQAKITATALANQKLEEARNLPYQKVGIEGRDEAGAIKAVEYYPLDTQYYTITSDVACRNNPADGPGDTCLCDYKTVRVSVSWTGFFAGEISLATDIAPKNDIQECQKKGGVLEISVFDAKGQPVSNIEVQIEDILTGNKNYCLTDVNGQCKGENGIFLNTSTESENYKIIIPKPGTSTNYSVSQTFRTNDSYGSKIIAVPEKPNATILEGQITEMSFSIDLKSAFLIETRSSRGKTNFTDDFLNMSKISDYSNIVVSEGEAVLDKSNGDYFSSGFLISTNITFPNLQGWDQWQWIDSTSAATEITYQLLYFDGLDWVLIPDSALQGNSSGLGPSPADLSNLDSAVYDKLRAKAAFSSSDLSQTPHLFQWNISYFTRIAQPVNASFNIRGEKIVGKDSAEEPIYKYPLTPQTINKSGQISDLEWDSYNFSEFKISGQSVELEQGIPGEILTDNTLLTGLAPDVSQSLTLYLAAENTLLVQARDSETLEPVFSADIRLYNSGIGYDKTQETDQEGKTFFIPLEEAVYNLEVSAQGYEVYQGQVSVSGAVDSVINLVLSPS